MDRNTRQSRAEEKLLAGTMWFQGTSTPHVITPGYIEELDDKGRLRNNKYQHYKVTDEECDRMGEMCDPYEGLWM